VIAGGAVTIVIALGWSRLFPALAGVNRLRELQPVASAEQEPIQTPTLA
jgi:hypothetical protein